MFTITQCQHVKSKQYQLQLTAIAHWHGWKYTSAVKIKRRFTSFYFAFHSVCIIFANGKVKNPIA